MAGLITEKIFIPGRGDLACFSERVLGLNSRHRFIRWWLRFDVIQDLLNYVWVSDVSDDTHSSATQRAEGNINVNDSLEKTRYVWCRYETGSLAHIGSYHRL